MRVSGTLFTVFGGVAGAVACTAGKTAAVGTIVYDKYMAYDDASSKQSSVRLRTS